MATSILRMPCHNCHAPLQVGVHAEREKMILFCDTPNACGFLLIEDIIKGQDMVVELLTKSFKKDSKHVNWVTKP